MHQTFTKHGIPILIGLAITSAGVGSVAQGQTQVGSGFNYQGQLKQDGLPLNQLVDVEFSLHEDPVAVDQVGTEYRIDAVAVVNGLFNVEVDFGVDAFNGSARWVEVHVRIPHDPTDVGSFITLDPRQPITVTPYALQTRGIVVDSQGEVGIGTDEPNSALHVLVNTTTGILAEANAGGATAIEGSVFANSGGGAGVLGKTFTPSGSGVQGDARSQTGNPTGVSGIVQSPEGARAVSALSLATAGESYAIHADVRSPDGYAGYFEGGRNYFEGSVGIGTDTPLVLMHLARTAHTGTEPAIRGEDLLIEDSDAVIGIYSDSSGSVGSMLSLKQIAGGTMTDNWSIWRGSSGGDSALHFSYGVDPGGASNQDLLKIRPTGEINIAPTARQITYSAADFVVSNVNAGNITFHAASGGIIETYWSRNGSCTLLAPVHLPHGAQIDSLAVFVGDHDAVANWHARLIRNEVGVFESDTIGDAVTEGTPERTSLFVPITPGLEVFDSSRPYWLLVTTFSGEGSPMVVYGATIEYTIDTLP